MLDVLFASYDEINLSFSHLCRCVLVSNRIGAALLGQHLDSMAWLLEKRIDSEKWPSTGIASSRNDLAGCVVVAGQRRRRTSAGSAARQDGFHTAKWTTMEARGSGLG